ncbi:branched-chain amino acid ABC transporter permease [Breoghania sp. L-A4]|uniref:branched-chain amino acid ABC transporter permease n=1 Tax=Breoghania sp. L-A4 TaxID=2304600 RepID=UPI000E359DE7|nr:branched-chain amino acid ABC transporter permease [Breoghania sp. L-A4]AXS41736.1 branched-chain amino acid ABC transporter permease [Breoghania sp. L-A4]
MSLGYLLQQILNTLQVAGFYALLAVAYILLHGVTGRINLAFGAMAMWGGSMTIAGFGLAGILLPYATAIPLVFALGYGLAASVLLGLVLAAIVVKPLANSRGLAMLIATIGVAIVLEETVRLASLSRELWMEPVLADPVLLLGGEDFAVLITPMRLIVLAACAALTGGLLALLRLSAFGRAWRAVSEDAAMARLLGINTGATITATLALSALLAGSAGALMAVLYGNSSFSGGMIIGLKALYVVILGGFAAPGGAVLGALALAGFETAWTVLVSATYRDVASFAAMTALLMARPTGLLADPLR